MRSAEKSPLWTVCTRARSSLIDSISDLLLCAFCLEIHLCHCLPRFVCGSVKSQGNSDGGLSVGGLRRRSRYRVYRKPPKIYEAIISCSTLKKLNSRSVKNVANTKSRSGHAILSN